MKKNERLHIILKTLNLTQIDFAESIGTTQPTLSRQLKDIHKIDKQVALAIQAVHNISAEWILTGKGEMFLPTSPQYQKQAAVPNSRRDRIIAELSQAEQTEINDYIEYRATRAGVDISKIKEPPVKYADVQDGIDVPLLGRIPAGIPMLAEENIEEMLHVPSAFLPRRKKDFFAVTVRGDSMIGAGIIDGDIAILEKIVSPRDEISNGDIVAALIDGEATLKRLFFVGDKAELRAENPKFKTIPITKKDFVLIQGKAVLLVRDFKGEE
ncbi:MAG: transcriptional repressor LexA [Leptospirales bacterium]|nr:transcriptional repressor LexA [Leptospirales bacterium]